ncbi:hypothetical protein [Nonomuraea dietziae]|uniref:hypothetical protein n=1 Tax=Nonomuraea dietziae TaxID=65515 RepID=UPI0034060010
MSVECRQDGAHGTGGRVAAGGALFSVAVALTALNLRPAVTSVGPLLDETRASLGASETWAGLLTTVPVLCFAVAGLIAPLLARRAGVGRRSPSRWRCWRAGSCSACWTARSS